MNRTEWESFAEELFIAFPGFLANLNQKSPNPQATLETWFETLKTISLSEAKSVIKEWQTGTKEPPKAFELDYVAIIIRSRVGGMRSVESRYRTAKSLYDEKQQALQRRREYEPLIPDMVEAFESACKAGQSLNEGLITLDEYNRILRKSVGMVA
jgi:hypothetical protein